jgi:uroporphyrinogen decarboxylase
VDWWDVSDISNAIDRINAKDEYAIMIGAGNLFEIAWWMRGLERMMIDLIENPELAYEIMRRVTDYKIEYLTKILEAGKGKIDIVITADDIAGQSKPLPIVKTKNGLS